MEGLADGDPVLTGHPAEPRLAKLSRVFAPWRHVFRGILTSRWPPEWGRPGEHEVRNLHPRDGENNTRFSSWAPKAQHEALSEHSPNVKSFVWKLDAIGLGAPAGRRWDSRWVAGGRFRMPCLSVS